MVPVRRLPESNHWLLGILYLLITCLPCNSAQGQQPSSAARPLRDKFYTRRPEFDVPFQVDSRSSDLVEVQLMASIDRGRQWQPVSRGAPTDRALHFRAPRDGEYWLSTRTLDRFGRAKPEGPLEPQLCAVVDTSPPRLAFQAIVGPAGNIQARWDVQDEHLATHTFRVVVQSGVTAQTLGAEQLLAVEPLAATNFPGRYQGSVNFWPEARAAVLQIRAEVWDQAGNYAVAAKPLEIPLRGARRPDAVGVGPALAANTPMPGNRSSSGNSPVNGNVPAPAAAGPGLAVSNVIPGLIDSPPSPTGPGRNVSSSSSNDLLNPASPPTQPAEGNLPGGERPRMTNAKKFSLDYDVESAGPGGVADVELWGTRDRGATWSRWAIDDDRRSPFDIEVDAEGLYGFRVVVISRSGLASSAPVAGDPADLWVQVDQTPPRVQLTSVSFGEGQHSGELDIRWDARDEHLGLRPITLSYAETNAGPWHPIASGLTNSGQYFWRIVGQIPSKAILRIEARDEADNQGRFQTAEPISLLGLNPAGRIRSFQPARP
ncbi:MAG: hypothetical protein ACKOBW_14815 [Planctomycetota bacterium]